MDIREHSPAPKPSDEIIEMIEDNDGNYVECRQIKTGAWQSVETGRIVRQARPYNFENKEMATAAAHKRYEKHQEAVQRGVIAAVEEDSGLDNLDWSQAQEITAKVLHREIVLSSEAQGRDRIRGWSELNKQAGFDPTRQHVDVDLSVAGMVTFADTDTILLKMFHDLYPGDNAKVLESMQLYKAGKWKK